MSDIRFMDNTCGEQAKFETQWSRPISQHLHTLCIHITKVTGQRHHRSPVKKYIIYNVRCLRECNPQRS